MRNTGFKRFRISLLHAWFLAGVAFAWPLVAQGPEAQQRIAELKEAVARNKQGLAQYTWVEQDTIILKGEQKKQEQFQVRLGPDGKPQKTLLNATAPTQSGHEGRLKEHIIEKKKEEYKEYADRIRELIRQYLPPDKDALEQARQKGNILVGAEPNMPGQYRAVISNYIKPGDSMTLVIDPAQKNIVRLSIATYLDDPKDAVKVDAVFSPISGGPNHVSSATINGVSKQLTITVENSNYQRL